MATSKPIPLRTKGDVARVVAYIVDEKRESHKEYTIESDFNQLPETFAADLEHAVESINAEAGRSHAVKIRANWLIVRFEDNSNLTKSERGVVAGALKTGLAAEAEPWAWHINRLTGASDYNLIISAVMKGVLPRLRRWVGQSLWGRVKTILDSVVSSINQQRAAAGVALLREMPDVQRQLAEKGAGPGLGVKLGRVAHELCLPITVQTLPQLLGRAGYSESDWQIREDEIRLRLREGGRLMKLKLDRLILDARSVQDGLEKAKKATMNPSPPAGVVSPPPIKPIVPSM